jgi:hypothetical protein
MIRFQSAGIFSGEQLYAEAAEPHTFGALRKLYIFRRKLRSSSPELNTHPIMASLSLYYL